MCWKKLSGERPILRQSLLKDRASDPGTKKDPAAGKNWRLVGPSEQVGASAGRVVGVLEGLTSREEVDERRMKARRGGRWMKIETE